MIKITKKIFFFILLVTVLKPPVGIAQTSNFNQISALPFWFKNNKDSVKTSAKSPTGAMIRSMVFPGLGQLYNKKYFKAILIFGVETGLIANSMYLNKNIKNGIKDTKRASLDMNRISSSQIESSTSTIEMHQIGG